jgi:hypothetical protein
MNAARNPETRRKTLMHVCAIVVPVAWLLSACVFQDVRDQHALLDATCMIEGTAATASANDRPIVVALLRPAGATAPGRKWLIADHFVLEAAGGWAFAVPPGEYRLAAFEDSNRDLRYQPGEPFLGVEAAPPIRCTAGTRARDIVLRIPASSAGGRSDTIAATPRRGLRATGRARRSRIGLTCPSIAAGRPDAAVGCGSIRATRSGRACSP